MYWFQNFFPGSSIGGVLEFLWDGPFGPFNLLPHVVADRPGVGGIEEPSTGACGCPNVYSSISPSAWDLS